jgi:hypothetical protein
MAVRFMPDGRLKLESGALLDRSERIDSVRATAAARAGMRTLLSSYPETTDITSERATVEALVAKVEGKTPTEYGARIYASGEDRVLVIEHFH